MLIGIHILGAVGPYLSRSCGVGLQQIFTDFQTLFGSRGCWDDWETSIHSKTMWYTLWLHRLLGVVGTSCMALAALIKTPVFCCHQMSRFLCIADYCGDWGAIYDTSNLNLEQIHQLLKMLCCLYFCRLLGWLGCHLRHQQPQTRNILTLC